MTKKIAAILVICVGIIFSGCASNHATETSNIQPINNTSSAPVSKNVDNKKDETGKVNSSVTAKANNSQVNNNVNKNDYSKYSGNWTLESSLKADYKYGTTMTIKVDKYGNLKGEVGSLTENATHIANVDINGKIINNEFKYNFKEDNWGHSGIIKLKFQNDTIILDINYDSNSSNNNLWGIGEGTFTLVKNTMGSYRTLDDLKNGGLQVIENQSFNINLENFGTARLVCGSKRENASETLQIYLIDNNNNVLYKFDDFYGNEKGGFKGISAISFADVDNDGEKDIVIIAKYSIGKSNSVSVGSIYFNKGKEFKNDKNLDDKINKSSSRNSISTMIKFAKENLNK